MSKNHTPYYWPATNAPHVYCLLSLCYIGYLLKNISVTPQRHRGFFVPVISASQAVMISAKQHPSQVQSVHIVYGWRTSQNKPYGEYAGLSLMLQRVTPPTLLNLLYRAVTTQKTSGGRTHA